MDLARTEAVAAFGQPAVLTVGAVSVDVEGIFRREIQTLDLGGGGVPVNAVREVFDVRQAALDAAGVSPRVGNTLVTGGVTYRIVDRPEGPVGTQTLVLESVE